MADETTRLLSRCLSVDLEVNVSDRRIRALAGVRPDSGTSFVFPASGGSLAAALAKLDDLAAGTNLILNTAAQRSSTKMPVSAAAQC